MIPNITRGSRMCGLMVYLASTDANTTKNAHQDPHLVAGEAAIMAWSDDGVLDREDALAIAKHLDRPRKMFGVPVQIKDMQWDAAKKERVPRGEVGSNLAWAGPGRLALLLPRTLILVLLGRVAWSRRCPHSGGTLLSSSSAGEFQGDILAEPKDLCHQR